MNDGLSAAKGELVCFVSADDVILPGAVKTAVDFLKSHPELDGMFGMTGYMNGQAARVEYPVFLPRAPFSLVKYLAHVPHCSFYIRRASLERHGLTFDASLSFVGDYEWMTRISQKRLKIGKVKTEFSLVRFHPLQATQVHFARGSQEIAGVYKRHAVNLFIRKLALWVYFFYFRWWQLGQEIGRGGLRAAFQLFRNFFGKLARHISGDGKGRVE
jgi:glycosyltransferase involved in cell wall biosynthesis